MATEELVIEQFQFLGIDVEKEVLAKCVMLCDEYNVDAEAFVEQWMAYSVSNLNGAPPTVDDLNTLERKEFSKRGRASSEKTRLITGSPPKLFSAAADAQSDLLLSNYVPTAKKIKPESESYYSSENVSEPVGPPTKYSTREHSGSVVLSFGNETILKSINKASDSNIASLNIKPVPNYDGETYTKAMFGFELLHEKAGMFDNHLSYLTQCIMKKSGINETSSVRYKSQSDVWVCGRVECDADARLQPKCAVLQGSWDQSLSQAVPLDLDQANQYSLFPGQVVVVRGTNPRGDKFVVQEVYCDAAPQIMPIDLEKSFKGTMNIIVASGPYTTSDNLSYEPLKDLLAYIVTHKPHVVIMTGPFLDSDHQDVKSNKMTDTFKAFFDRLLDGIGDVNNSSPWTKIYLVSSLKDAFHLNIYPTPAYTTRRKHPNIQFLPDPCTLDINGVIVGVTSTDVLMHISQEEISFGAGGDKLSRLAGHALSQQCYYPLWPPPTSQPLDVPLWTAHAQIPVAPHILVLPSNFRYFVKDVKGCIVVNPEHLTKGIGGGTFARIQLNIDENTTHISKSMAAQIVRI